MTYMDGMPLSLLSQRCVLRLSGADVLPFLQGLVTTDVLKLPQGAQFSALLTPQGKYLHSFFLYWRDGAVLLEVAGNRLEELRKRLLMYRLRSQVVIEECPLRVVACWGGDRLPEAVEDPRLAALGFRALVMLQDMPPALVPEVEYDAMRLRLGVPEDGDMLPEGDFPLLFGFEYLHAVDFHKGCYVGQEVTARTKHRGRLSKLICSVKADMLPPSGTALLLGGQAVGEMRSSQGGVGLALVKAEAVGQAIAQGLDHANGRVSLSMASWFSTALEA